MNSVRPCMYLCATPDISNYIKANNIIDGQTDKIVWMFMLHGKELLQMNPYTAQNEKPSHNEPNHLHRQEKCPKF